MRIGIVCAGDSEVAPFLSMIRDYTVTEKAMLKFYDGWIENIPVVVLFSGVCKVNAAIATQILIDTFQCGTIINAGTAGGMNPDIKLFDTVVSTESAYWDVADDILTDFHPWAKSVFWKADNKFVELLRRIVARENMSNVYFGRTVTGEMFIEEQYRAQINEKFAPLCVDMETAAVAHVCYVNRIPYVTVRTITDTSECAGEEVFEENCEKASRISAKMVKLLLREIETMKKNL